MPYSYPNNIPRVAKHWSPKEQERCTAAANAILRSGKSEAEAIYGCIHAAGKTRKKMVGYKQDHTDYDAAEEDGRKAMQHLVRLFLAGAITLAVLHTRMRDVVRDINIRMMLLALGAKTPTAADLAFLESKIAEQYKFLEGFIDDILLKRLSDERMLWRAGLYAAPRSSFVAYTIPLDVAMMMPVLPGDDCLGNCHCFLEVEDSRTRIVVHWILDPSVENCVVCIEHATESPFVFSLGD